MVPPVFDTVFWVTGVIIWSGIGLFCLVYVLPALPGLCAFVAVLPAHIIGKQVERRYYDNADDVEAARQDRQWHYYVTHYLFRIRQWGFNTLENWMDGLDPYYDRLPMG